MSSPPSSWLTIPACSAMPTTPLRWAKRTVPVSYTHLDVYKRQGYWCKSSGSYHALIPAAAGEWGLPVSGCTTAEPQRITDALANGKLVVAIMSEGHFTSSGHFIVLRGVKDGKIMVADPASYTRSEQLWDLSIILNAVSYTHLVADNPLYHDTWKLLKKYRDVVWSLELSVQHVRTKFEIEYGTSIEDFLDSVYLAGADLAGSDIEHHAKCIERSHKMLKLLDSAVELLRTKHKNGEAYYWLLYYSFLSPQQLKNVEEIIETLRPHIRDISFRTYYRKRREAIEALIVLHRGL